MTSNQISEESSLAEAEFSFYKYIHRWSVIFVRLSVCNMFSKGPHCLKEYNEEAALF